jgi:hypothetical protein
LDNKDPIKLVEIQTMFMLLNWGVKFNQQFLKQNKLNSFLRLPMSNENLVVPEELLAGLEEVLDTHKGIGKSNQSVI